MKTTLDQLFKGYQNTPLLWNNKSAFDLPNFIIPKTDKTLGQNEAVKKQRLGHWVEDFAAYEMEGNEFTIKAKNLQILDEQKTIGELDFLILKNDQPIHIEVVYKFYLYDSFNKNSPSLAHWIGPNRKDELLYKLDKLKKKQLPLLFHKATQPYLRKLDLNSRNLQQFVHFKAQLFIPLTQQIDQIKHVNKSCIQGCYIRYESLKEFEHFHFYLPKKLEWLAKPYLDANWKTYDDSLSDIEYELNHQYSVLCWIRDAQNNLQKLFVTWW